MRVDERSGQIIYSKSSSDTNDKSAGSIDLKMVRDIVAYEKNGVPDYTRFNVDLGEKVYKFKVNSENEGQKWVEGLNAWRDYFLLNMS